ncbi:ATP-binding protein [candidate division KSB1 bacterium]
MDTEKDIKHRIEELEIQLRHIQNDYDLTRQEFDEASGNYLETITELHEKNKTLLDFQKNLEELVTRRTKELRETKEILQVKADEQQVILDSSPALIFYTDAENRFVRVNQSFSNTVELPIKEIIGKTIKDIFPEDHVRMERDNNYVLRTGETKNQILEQIHTKKGKRWIVSDKIPYKDLKGSIIGVIGFALDITDRKALEKQLVHSEKLAAVGRLVAGVAHELNNPLAIISGFSELLKDAPCVDEKNRKMIDSIIAASERSASIVENLLRFSRKSKMEKTNVDLMKIIDDAITMTNNSIIGECVNIIKQYTDLPETDGDASQLNSVFVNLINNARDAMLSAKKGDTITISGIVKDNVIVFEVYDNGPGIPDENQNEIFDPFFSSKEVGKGTGLGLSICYGIVTEHNGTIYLDNSYKDGAKFVVSLPVSETTCKSSEENGHSKIPEFANILIVDDEPQIIELEKMLLHGLNGGYMIDEAEDGETALELIKNNNFSYDLVLCDMKMPGSIDGLDLYKTLYERNKFQASRMIFVTGDISGETKDFLDKNHLYYISKPFNMEKFTAVIGEFFFNSNKKK